MHTVYFAGNRLKHVYFDGRIYHPSVEVASGFDAAAQNRVVPLVAVPGGKVAALYYDHVAENLVLATWNGSTWDATTTTPWSLSGTGLTAAMVRDGTGTLHIAFDQNDIGRVRYTSYNGSTWTAIADLAPRSNDLAASLAIAVDAANEPIIAYSDTGSLMVARRVAGSWAGHIETADPWQNPALRGSYPAIAVDASGAVHVTHYAPLERELRYSRRSPTGAWSTVVIDDSAEAGEELAMALDTQGALHVSYSGFYGLRYATNLTGDWLSTTIEDSPCTGHNTALAIDQRDLVHIIHTDVCRREVRHAFGRLAGSLDAYLVERVSAP